MARDPIEYQLFPLLSAKDLASPTSQGPLEQTILDLRVREKIDDVAIALLNLYAHAETRVECERVLEGLATLYSSLGGKEELFPSDKVQVIYTETLFEVVKHSKSPDVRVNAMINLRLEDYGRIGMSLLNALTLALRDSSSAVRYRAAMQLVELDRDAALEILIAALNDPLCHITQDSLEGRSSAVWEILMALDEFGSDPPQARLIVEEVARFMQQVTTGMDLGYLDIWKAA
ncbi:MAG TPA: HEAT repeat domain-containing protein, partial [Blastocatellia bacterium]|nr:HEAT repeat domain-containing protein [Blastocatellia bacterium]